MTFVTRFNPRKDLLNDFRRMEALFEPFFRFPEEMQNSAWNPPVDVLEENDRIVVKLEVAGVDEKDLHVTFEDGLLTITGERQFEKKEDRNYHRIERAYGSFTRSFTLPRTVDPSQISASYRNGVLEIEVPKKEESRPKQIEIKLNSRRLDA
jgi:HSP20 family protein